MNKKEFIDALAAKIEGLTKKDASVIVETIGEVITDALTSGTNVAIPGIGKLVVKDVPEKTGIIRLGERKGEEYTTPAHKKVSFKASTALKDALK